MRNSQRFEAGWTSVLYKKLIWQFYLLRQYTVQLCTRRHIVEDTVMMTMIGD